MDMSIFVVRAFLRLRDLTAARHDIATKLTKLERRVGGHDDELRAILRALRELIQSPPRARRAIGFAAGAATAPRGWSRVPEWRSRRRP